jgi:hypothetical protein
MQEISKVTRAGTLSIASQSGTGASFPRRRPGPARLSDRNAVHNPSPTVVYSTNYAGICNSSRSRPGNPDGRATA